jgi:hypothetical protein
VVRDDELSAMTSPDAATPPLKIWGYWATMAWAVAAFLIGQFAALALMLLWQRGDLSSMLAMPYDGIMVTLFILISNPVTVAVLAVAVAFARADFIGYMGLTWPSRRDVALGIICLVVMIAVGDALLYLSGRAVVTPFQLQSYVTAKAEGWVVPMAAAAILVAPAGEEIMFRGFLFRGFIRSPRSAWPGIIVISLLWAGLHLQYDWAGMLQIFIIGLFLGWMRWRSGSLLLTFLLHALFNLEGTLETAVFVKWLS